MNRANQCHLPKLKMDHQLLSQIVNETNEALRARFLGKVFQLSKLSFAFDFGLRTTFLLVSVDPTSPRYYLVERRQKDLEKQSTQLSGFGQLLRSRLGGGEVREISKYSTDRIVKIEFDSTDEVVPAQKLALIIQLTGKSSNLLLVDQAGRVIDILRDAKDPGQQPGDTYTPPPSLTVETSETTKADSNSQSPSAQADQAFTQIDERVDFERLAKKLRFKVTSDLSKQRKLKVNLQNDLQKHGDADTHKKLGDLLLANIGTAVRTGDKVRISDFYDEGTPVIELEIDPNTSLQEEAARHFRQYTKAKRAREAAHERLLKVDEEIKRLESRQRKIEQLIELEDKEALENLEGSTKKVAVTGKKKAKQETVPGVRRYLSSDGYEVWVGRAARDNDNLTFRLARPYDLWLHTGDYPGSHVIVRNSTKKEIPHRTIIEAAQLAARFSQASADSKVVVHYSERKFISKPKGAAPGLVRLSSFRSITVEPKEMLKRIM